MRVTVLWLILVLSSFELYRVNTNAEKLTCDKATTNAPDGGCASKDAQLEENNIDKEILFQPFEMRRVKIDFSEEVSLSVLEAPSSFCSTGTDDTGLVIWGPSVALSQYMMKYQQKAISGRKVLELGCGLALPSMMAYRLGASAVLATDFHPQTLEQVQFHADLNQCSIHVELVDWEYPTDVSDFRADIVLAADVIYGLALVPALVKIIERVLPKTSTLIIATRDGRTGIHEFRDMMESHFVEVQVERSKDRTYLPPIPSAIASDPLSFERWKGNHSIFTYRWREEE